MDKNSIWKWLILLLVTAWSLVIVYPPFDKLDADGNVVRSGKLKLGLDLRGGTSFTLEVDTSTLEPNALKDAQSRALEVIRNRVDTMGISEPIIYPEPRNNRIIVQIPGLKTEDRERAIKNLQSAAFLEFRMVHPKNDELVSELFEKGEAPDGYRMVSVDDTMPNGGYRTRNYLKRDTSKDPAGMTETDIRNRLKTFHAPPGYEFLLAKEVKNDQTLYEPYYVSRRRELTGESLKNAGVDYQQFGQPIVNLSFDAKGARRFSTLTSDYAPGGAKNPSPDGRRYLAIVLDGTLYSAPFIKTAILGGNAIIEGSFTLKEAQDLAIVLRAGSLPAPVKVIEERSVDPTLGADSVASGKKAALYGCIAIMVFMIAYYRLCGLVANLALVMNLVLLPLGMIAVSGLFSLLDNSGLGGGGIGLPTLTLPGIAGIVLTIGMAVDANVLIYERMREEQKLGKKFGTVVAAGYDKAFSAIFDSNLTTILAGAIMFWLGSGPVRGYAVTLSAGIIVSLYTAIVVTRMVFELLVKYTNIQQVKMSQWVRETRIDFIKARHVAIGFALIVLVVSSVLFVLRGKENLGVDFTGGVTAVFEFAEKQPVENIRDTLASAGVKDASIQYQKLNIADVSGENMEIKVGFDEGEKAVKAIQEAFPGYTVTKQDSVGPQVGKELQKKGILAIAVSLIGMIIYIAWRFEFGFAMGAVVALLYDAIICVVVYCLFGRQLTVNSIAAVLTIIGFSVNDTIVIFDRIRENVKLYRGKSFYDICNQGINECLGRTLLTSFTALMSVTALLIFGGGAINDFALMLFIGMISGVFSTIYIATPVAMLWHPDKILAARK